MNTALGRGTCHGCRDVRGVHRTGVSGAANVVPDAEQGADDDKSSSGGKVNLAAEEELMEEGHAHTSEGFGSGEIGL